LVTVTMKELLEAVFTLATRCVVESENERIHFRRTHGIYIIDLQKTQSVSRGVANRFHMVAKIAGKTVLFPLAQASGAGCSAAKKRNARKYYVKPLGWADYVAIFSDRSRSRSSA